MIVNLTPIEPGDAASPNLWNSRYAAITEVINGNIDSDNIKDGAITREKIASDAITNDKLNLQYEYSGSGSFINMGNFLIQWGTSNVASSGTDITFPRPFSSPPSVNLTIRDPNDQTAWLLSAGNTKFRAKQPWTPNPLPVSWIAVGPA